MAITVDDTHYHDLDRRKGCAVEYYARDPISREISLPSTKLDWVYTMKSVEEERADKVERMMRLMEDRQYETQNKIRMAKH